jgi:hypothetical protein
MNTGTAALMGALRGPLMLMTLGGLLTAHRFTDVTFGKTWPVLLIVFGLMKLLQRVIGPENHEPLTPGMAGGE